MSEANVKTNRMGSIKCGSCIRFAVTAGSKFWGAADGLQEFLLGVNG